MMSRKNKIALAILIIGALFLSLVIWYKYEYSMYKVEAYEVNTPNLNKKLIIATQGSEFKDAITERIIDHYKQDSIFIKVIDVSSLQKIEPKNYNAIVVMHTWENWKPPVDVQSFIDSTKVFQEKIIVLTTSGKGTFKMENVDAITCESKLENSESHSAKIIKKLTPLLNQ